MTLTSDTTSLPAQQRLHLARSWQLRGDLERAIAGYWEVIRLAPDHPLAYQLLGELYSKEKQFEAATTVYVKALEVHPNMAEFHKGLTNALIQTRGLEHAFEHYRLRQISDNPPVIAPDAVLCCMVVRNEELRLPYLLSYYRQKGVDRFLMIDNGSTDNTQAYLLEQPDVTLWQGDLPFSYVNCGSAWFELLLRKYGLDHWCLIVDADELLYYPDCETRTLRQLCADLDRQHKRVLTAVLLDMYTDRPIQDTHYQSGQNFLEVCPYFDRQFYHRKEENPAPYYNQTRYIGGMRERVFGGEYWLNKVPLIKYSPAMILTGGQHRIGVSGDQIATETGAVLHFKYFDSFDHYVLQEIERQERDDHIHQYQAYARCLNEANSITLYDPSVSLRLRDSQQLVELGVMQAGEQANLILTTDLPQVLPAPSQIHSPSELERHNIETPLMKAAELGDVERAESLLEQGFDPNEQNDHGQTALYLITQSGHESDRPLISVIIPVHNGERFLAEAIQNIQQQNYQPLEIIVVDDGSTDRTAEIAAHFQAQTRYVYQSNQGPASARNRGLKLAQGELIAFHDVDDLWTEHILADFISYLVANPDIEIVQGLIQCRQIEISEEYKNQFIYRDVSSPYQFINLGSAIFRKSVFDKVGLLDETLWFNEDTDLFLRAWEQNITKVVLPKVMLLYRKHNCNMTLGRNADLIRLSLTKLYWRHFVRLRSWETKGIPYSPALVNLSDYLGQSSI